jgi:ribosome biogenesis protein Tsr3
MLTQMLFAFPSKIQEGLASGIYEVMTNSAGQPLSMARDVISKKIVGHAVEVVAQPLLAIPNMITGGLSIIGDIGLSFQIDRGFQKTERILGEIKDSISVLQSTTALIGVASFAGVALGAANLYQVMKLRQEVKDLRISIKDGFSKTLEEIHKIPDQVKFEHHRTILIMAYGEFLQATKLMKSAIQIQDSAARNVNLGNAQLHLSNALNAYRQDELFYNTCAAGKLRRFECIWIMEQTNAFNYLLLNAPEAASHCLQDLQQEICHYSLEIIDHCESEKELDFVYPEIAKIHNQDIPLLKAWKNQIDWTNQLSKSEKEELVLLLQNQAEETDSQNNINSLQPPAEIGYYQQLKAKSHYESLRDQLKLTVHPQLRRDYEQYIKEQAIATEQKGLISANWQDVSDLTIANVYHYFKDSENIV